MKKVLIVLGIVIVAAAAFFMIFKKSGDEIDREAKLAQRDLSVQFRATGSVNPRNRLEIKPPFSGRIEEMLVNEGDNVKKGQIIAWMSSSERASMLDAARAVSQAEYKKWSEIYKPTPIIAPMNGFIILRAMEPGQTISAADAVLVMADDLIIESNVDETDLRYIKIGDKFKLSLDAYPDEEFEGIVEHIAYESKIVSNVTVYNIKIRPVKKPSVFRSGMTATITITAESKQGAWSLPNAFITERGKSKTVLVKTSKGLETRKVETGITDGRYIEVTSGITKDDTVVILKTQAAAKAKSFMSR